MRIGKIARIVGIVGGLGAVGWAMRDRFVTLALSREPEHPTFTLPPDAPATPSSTPDDLTAIGGIGPVFARRLMEAGIATFAQLAGADPNQIASIVNITDTRAAKWVDEASQFVKA